MLGETVNPANGSVSLRIQVPVPKGRQLTLPFAFAYDSNGAWFASEFGSGQGALVSRSAFLSSGGWSYSVPLISEAFGQNVGKGNIPPTCDYYTDYVLQDASGGRHALGIAVGQYGTRAAAWCRQFLCSPPVTTFTKPTPRTCARNAQGLFPLCK